MRAVAAFRNTDGQVRSGWWIAVFLGLLAAMLIGAQLAAPRLQHRLSILDQLAMLVAATWICQLLRRQKLQAVMGRWDGHWLADFAAGGTIGAALMGVPALLLFAGGWVSFYPGLAGWAVFGGGLLAMAGVAATEELLFRGFLFQRLIDGLGVWPAQLLIGGFFLLTHLDNPGMAGAVRLWAGVNIFTASILFGLCYLRTQSLAMPISLHFMANVLQGPVLGFGVSGNAEAGLLAPQLAGAPVWLTGGAFGLEASLPGLACLLFTTVLVYRLIPAASAPERPKAPL
jgi:hypothetical protein